MRKLLVAILAIWSIQFGANAQSPLLGDTVLLKAQFSGDEVQITVYEDALMDTLTALSVIEGRTIGDGVVSLLALWDSVQTVSASLAAGFSTCGDEIGYDGYDYATVQIGGQCWFAENLRNENYNDGNPIPSGLNGAAWSTTTDGAVAVYDDDEATYLADYGRLYNWHAVNTGNLCPSGWHVPTIDEWTTLSDGLGGISAAGGALKSAPSDSPAWDGTNSSGFSALAGGFRNAGGGFMSGGSFGYFWSSYPDGTNAWFRALYSGGTGFDWVDDDQRSGFSVRCVLD